MRYTAREFIVYTFAVVLLFVALTHSAGLVSSIGAAGKAYAGGVAALEGH